MGLLNIFKSIANPKQMATNSSTAPNSTNWSGNSFDFSNWQGRHFYGDYSSTISQNPEVFSVISRLSSVFASLPIHAYKNGTEKDGPIANLLRVEPNPNMSGFKMMRMLEVDRNKSGNAFALIVRDDLGNPIQLWPISSSNVLIKRNTDDNSIWYQVTSEQFKILIQDSEMIHVNQIETVDNSDWGVSPLDVLNGSLRFQKAVQDFSMAEMAKKNAYIVKYERNVSPEKRQAILNDIANMERNNGGALLEESGFDIERYESKFQPADLQTSEAVSRTRIANAFNVPLSFLNDGQAKSTVNVEHVMTEFVEMTLTPIVKQYEGEFNRKLLTRNQRSRGWYLKFNVNGLMRGDTAARTQLYQMGMRNGLYKINEIRKLEDLPPIKEKNAEQVWFSGDLYPLSQAGQRVPSANNMQKQPKGGDDSDGKDNQDANSEDDADISDS